jgi:signal transduction histidine kinase
MKEFKTQFTLTGEFVDSKEETKYLDQDWIDRKKFFFVTYIACSFLLLMAGLVIDFNRYFYYGSAQQLTVLRCFLLISSFALFPLYWKKDHYPKTFKYFALYLTVLSSVVILLLNIMTGGQSQTLLPGILIITVSYYVVLPNTTLFSIVPSLIQMINFIFLYDTTKLGIGSHVYMSFMLVSINIVMCIFKVMHNKTSRTTFTMMEQHKESAKVKNTILGIIGHDLKNPLTAINLKLSLTQILLERGKIERVSTELNKIEHVTNKLNDLLQSLLNWAMDGNQSHDMKDNSMEQCFINAIGHCEDLANQKEISINENLEDQTFVFNMNMVETIIRNILVNAIKFTSTGKVISITGKKIENHYQILIADQGVGMSDDQIKMILNGEFIQSHDGTDGEKGAGLGMQLTNNFIKEHNGVFDIFSTKDVGTTFQINLPFNIELQE